MHDIRQSSFYQTYMRKLGWQVEVVSGVAIFIRSFPFWGSIAKIHRPDKIPDLTEIAKKYKLRSVAIELRADHKVDSGRSQNKQSLRSNELDEFYRINQAPYLHTRTIQIDLAASEETMFKRFSEAKRRAVRRAMKHGVEVREGSLEEFISLKKKDYWPLEFLMTKDMKALWESFPKKHKLILVATSSEKIIAGVLLLFNDQVASYWLATNTEKGKKVAAPSLLIWEALKKSKQRKCKVFDFEGIKDERFPKSFKGWSGFTKFKKGFGGREVVFPEPVIIKL